MEKENIGISFELKSPSNIFESQINTLIIDLRDLIDLHNHHYIEEPTIEYQNKIIDDMILELSTMKNIEVKENK